jgi:hypothetical protein
LETLKEVIQMFNTRLVVRLVFLVACMSFATIESRADSVVLNSSNSLLDGSHFTTGTTYYAVFQLVGGGTDNNVAQLSHFNFAGGSALLRDSSDPSAGTVALGPISGDLSGLGQAGATLQLTILPGDAYALFSQAINAGTLFSFDFSLTNNFTAGNSFDAFSFQLYSADLGTLLYEQKFDITGGPQPVPEPAALLLLGSGLIGVAASLRRRRR